MAVRRGKKSGMTMADTMVWAGRLGLVVVGVAAGYLWRSYLPLALPFESRLVADKSSDDLALNAREELAAERSRTEAAESEADRLRRRVETLESAAQKAEKQLAEMQIKSVLGGDGN